MNNNTPDLEALLDQALKAGADAADAVLIKSRSRGLSFRDGQQEDIEGSESETIGLRVLLGQRSAITSASDLRTATLDEMIGRTLAMAKLAPEDPFVGLAPAEALAQPPFEGLDLADGKQPSMEELAECARAAEAAARAIPGVTNSDGASASSGGWSIQLATSSGFFGEYEGTSHSISVSAVAGDGTEKERDYHFTSARHWEDLDDAAGVGAKAGEQAVSRLGSRQIGSGKMPVVYAPRVANSLLGHFIGAINGAAVARGSSFLKDFMGKEVFSPQITVTDDPLRPRGLRSRPFDGEGVRVSKMHLAENGILKSWMLNSAAARQLGLPVTGHGSRSAGSIPGISGSNLYIEAGDQSPTELIADIEQGFYVTELIGMGVNPTTGDYSRGAAGFLIEKGEITRPVSEITIAGNLKDMFRMLTPANDLEFRYGSNAPTLRVDNMAIAGA